MKSWVLAASLLAAVAMVPMGGAYAADVDDDDDRGANTDPRRKTPPPPGPGYKNQYDDDDDDRPAPKKFSAPPPFAAPGNKLFTVADVSEMIVKAPVADTVAAQLKVGETARVDPQDKPGEEMVGVISLVSRGSDAQSRSVEIWVNLKNEGGRLRANSAAKVVLTIAKADNAIVVPSAAVTLDTTTGDSGKVMVVDDQSIAHETKVTVGIRTLDRVEITSGLKGDETVVVEGSYALPDESKVKISEPEETEPPEK